MNDPGLQIRTNELFDCNIEYLSDSFGASAYPWEILPRIQPTIAKLLERGMSGYTRYSDTALIGENVTIARTATIEGFVILGPGCEIRPGAYIRGSVIAGRDCVIGNSTELKNCILLDHVQVPHYNYVGDSILGNFAHMGAGAICSNFRADGREVTVHGDTDYPTRLQKVGAFIGDHGEIGCGSVLNPGTIIGRGTRVYPLTCVRGVIPGGMIVKSMSDIIPIK